jgi:hypothetical protein
VGISSDGILVYGYDLGDEPENGYQDTPEWLKKAEEESEFENFAESAEIYLLAQSGFTDTDWESEGYWERKRAAEEQMGVEILYHCAYEYPMFIITVKDKRAQFRAYRGQPISLGIDQLNIPSFVKEEWDAKLKWASDLLGFKTTNERPTWILTSILG